MGKIVVDLGCGGTPHEDATHGVDIVPHDLKGIIFIQHDLRDLPLPFETESVDKVYMSHVLEHFTRDEAVAIVRDVFRMLKRGGKLVIDLPNVMRAFEYAVLRNPDIEAEDPEVAWGSVAKTLWGDPRLSPHNIHLYGWTHMTLRRMLEKKVGFKVVSINDPSTWAIMIEAVKP